MLKKVRSKLSADKDFRDLLTSSFFSFGLRIGGIGVGYLFVWLLSHRYGAATVGVFTLALTLLQIVSIFGRFGLDVALLRYLSALLAHGEKARAVGTYFKAVAFVAMVSMLLSLLLHALAEPVATTIFKNASLAEAFRTVSYAVVPMTLLNLNFETLRALKRIGSYAFLQNVSNFLWATLFLLLFAPWITDDRTVVLLFVFSAFLSWLISQILVIRAFPLSTWSVAGKSLSELLRTAFPMMISNSLMLVMGWTDTIMLGAFLDEKSVGVYSVALKISTLTSIALMAINSMAAPKFAELYGKGEMRTFQKIATQSSKMIFWSSVPILLVTVLFSPQILSLFGAEFIAASLALVILSIGQFFNAISGSVGYILQMTGNEKIFRNIILVSIGVNIFLNYLWIPVYGLEGAALASAISLTLWNLASVYFVKSKIAITTVYIPLFSRRGS